MDEAWSCNPVEKEVKFQQTLDKNRKILKEPMAIFLGISLGRVRPTPCMAIKFNSPMS